MVFFKKLTFLSILVLFFSSCDSPKEVAWQKINELIENQQLKELRIVDKKYTIVELNSGEKLKARLEDAPDNFLEQIENKRNRKFAYTVVRYHYQIYGVIEYYFFRISILGMILVFTMFFGWVILKSSKK